MPAPPTPSPPDTRLRDHAANERTLLAWVRTGIALMAFGFALARFGLFLREVALVGQVQAPHRAGTAWFGVVFVVLGLLSNAVATLRFARARAEIDGQRSPLSLERAR
jgi:putative membrane protein